MAHVTTEKAEAAAAKAALKALKKTHGEMQDIPFAQLQKLQERIGVKRFRGAAGRVGVMRGGHVSDSS